MRKKGVIVLLDALGISDRSIEESKIFLKNRDFTVDLIEKFSKSKDLKESFGDSEIYTFGDTILFTWEITTTIGPPLVLVGELLKYIIIQSAEQHILWRGAMSIGEYLEDKKSNTLVGPAISDAATWYEASNWFGVMTTPSCSLIVKQLFEEMSGSDVINKLNDTFIDYDIPLKESKTLRGYAIGWPFELLNLGIKELHGGNKLTPLAKLCSILSVFSIPKNTENKYFNAIDFFNYCNNQRKKRT